MEKVNIKEHLSTEVEAFFALSPSRNLIVQFLVTLPQDYFTIHESYPEFVRDGKAREALSKIFGVSYGKDVDKDEFGNAIIEFISQTFDRFDDEEFTNALDALLEDVRSIPLLSPCKEWLELRLRHISTMPNGQKALKLLRAITEKDRIMVKSYSGTSVWEDKEWPDFTAKMMSDLHMEESELLGIIELLRDKYHLFELKSHSSGSGATIYYYYSPSIDVKRHQELLK